MNKSITAFLLLAFFSGCAATANAQSAASLWKTLAKVSYEKKYDELLGFKVDVPVFTADVKALEGKTITISGYVVPVEGYKDHSDFVFSAFPYNMCYFCGGAGPETVMEVTATKPVKYTTDRITIRGKLLLNRDNINRLMYVMTDAVQVTDSGK